MTIKLMKVFEYDRTGWNCQETDVRDPSLEEIEAAVLRLNKFEFPFVWFFVSADVPEGAVPDLSIMGGDCDYVISTFDGNRTDRHMKFPSHSHKRIDVWLSDQGCDFEEKLICHDVGFVLDVVAGYAKSGTFPSATIWE